MNRNKQAQPSWDRLREAQLSSSVYSQISLAWKGQLREAQLSYSILSQISFAQNNLELAIPDWVLHANIDLDMVTGLWLTHILNFGFLSSVGTNIRIIRIFE